MDGSRGLREGMVPTKQERYWVLACAAILLLLYGIPALWAFLCPPEGFQLYRAWTYGEDYAVYRSAMAQGYAGDWLILNRFTPEPHDPVLLYPVYVLLGHAARLLPLPLEVPYLITSALGAACLALALYVFAAAFLIRLAETQDPCEAARFANVVASFSVEKPGMPAS